MPPESGLKHKPFSSLRGAVVVAPPPAQKPTAASFADKPALGRIYVREEFDSAASKVITRVIGLPQESSGVLGKQWREVLGHPVVLEGREVLVMAEETARIAELLRKAGASEVVVVRLPEVADLSKSGEAGGTERARIRRGLRVAIVQKADQESGALTEGIVRDILTSSPVHPRGIKVRLESGQVGRVRRIL